MSNPTIRSSPLTIPNRRSPVDVALDILKEKFPGALLAFVAGSFNRGEATLFSDIDLVVIFGKLDNAWRESFLFQDWPVEAFVHDPETLSYFFHEVDAKSGVPSLAAMVLEGPSVPFAHPMASELRAMAQNVLSSQATKWDTSTLEAKRYGITDLVDDLRDPRTTLEAAATIGPAARATRRFLLPCSGILVRFKEAHTPATCKSRSFPGRSMGRSVPRCVARRTEQTAASDRRNPESLWGVSVFGTPTGRASRLEAEWMNIDPRLKTGEFCDSRRGQ